MFLVFTFVCVSLSDEPRVHSRCMEIYESRVQTLPTQNTQNSPTKIPQNPLFNTNHTITGQKTHFELLH